MEVTDLRQFVGAMRQSGKRGASILTRMQDLHWGLKTQSEKPGETPRFISPRVGGSAGARTQDQYLKRVLLYQLSYRPVRNFLPFAVWARLILPDIGSQ
jgi:hypothetical protein